MTRAFTAAFLGLLLSAANLVTTPLHASDPAFWDHAENLPKPGLLQVNRLRFLTTADFAPLNYADATGRLAGFHIDLARNICDLLRIPEKCELQAMPFGELANALEARQGEAIIAGLAVTDDNRDRYLFTRPYLQFPARFAVRGNVGSEFLLDPELMGKRIGMLDDSAHEEMFRAYFPSAKAVVYSRENWMLEDLKEGKTDAVFHNAMRLSFWIGGSNSSGCCTFSGGPYFSTDFLGPGLAIATGKDQNELVDALNYALKTLEENGTVSELYLRYFPVGFY